MFRPNDDPAKKERQSILAWLESGDLDQLELAMNTIDHFPHGQDGFSGDRWILHAIFSGNLKSVLWMLGKGVELDFATLDGSPPLISCIDADCEDRYEILAALIEAGANMNERGFNGWTPLHLAAMRDDERAMGILLAAGADPTVRTNCDDSSTAEEEARNLGHPESADFIRQFLAKHKAV